MPTSHRTLLAIKDHQCYSVLSPMRWRLWQLSQNQAPRARPCNPRRGSAGSAPPPPRPRLPLQPLDCRGASPAGQRRRPRSPAEELGQPKQRGEEQKHAHDDDNVLVLLPDLPQLLVQRLLGVRRPLGGGLGLVNGRHLQAGRGRAGNSAQASAGVSRQPDSCRPRLAPSKAAQEVGASTGVSEAP